MLNQCILVLIQTCYVYSYLAIFSPDLRWEWKNTTKNRRKEKKKKERYIPPMKTCVAPSWFSKGGRMAWTRPPPASRILLNPGCLDASMHRSTFHPRKAPIVMFSPRNNDNKKQIVIKSRSEQPMSHFQGISLQGVTLAHLDRTIETFSNIQTGRISKFWNMVKKSIRF